MNYAEGKKKKKTKEKLDERWPRSGANYSMPRLPHFIVTTDSSNTPKHKDQGP